jgi:predicted porin
MQKKLLAVAVAGVLAAPAVALAQSSVTISGVFKTSFDQVKLSSYNTSGFRTTTNTLGTGNSSELRVTDDSSRIIFNVREDLGGGLAAIGQLDVRFTTDNGGIFGNGNNHVGLRSASWGTITYGRQDVHYGNTESRLTAKAGNLRADAISLMAYAGGGIVSVTNASRTPNLVRYVSPNWSGFTVEGGYSTNPLQATEADVGSPAVAGANAPTTTRKGYGWYFNPNYQASNFQVGWSHWDAKQDGGIGGGTPPAGIAFTAAGTSAFALAALAPLLGADQKADRLYGSYAWGGFRIGLSYDWSKLTSAVNNVPGTPTLNTNGQTLSKRTAWSLPIEYVMGNHNFLFHYTKANDDKSSGTTPGAVKSLAIANVCNGTGAGGLGTCDSSAYMYAFSYVYDVSKRTSLGLTYSKINNNNGAAYQPFTGQGALGSPSSLALPGEDPSTLAATIRHAF